MIRFFLILSIAMTPALAAPKSGSKYSLNDRDSRVKDSFYRDRITNFLKKWPHPVFQTIDGRPVLIRAIRTPKHPNIIGMFKQYIVEFPLSQVVALQENFEGYSSYLADIEWVKVESRNKNRIMTKWRRSAPVFFLADFEFRMLYTIDRARKDRVVYRQQFVDGDSLNSSETMIVCEKFGKDKTRITVLNFFDADFGPLKAVAEGTIWSSAQEGSFKDDIAFWTKLRHPKWSREKITSHAEKVLDENPFSELATTDLIQLWK